MEHFCHQLSIKSLCVVRYQGAVYVPSIAPSPAGCKVEDDFLKTSSMLWMLTWNVNTLIEPVLIEEAHPSPLFDEVLRTGVLV